MAYTKLTRHNSSSSLQNLLLDDDTDDEIITNAINIDDDLHHHHHHNHHHNHHRHHHHHDHDNNDCDDDDDLKDLADSCCSDGDVFDPPAWRPGRFLQFADIDLAAEDEPSVRPVSLPTERMGPCGRRCAGGDGFGSSSVSLSGLGLGLGGGGGRGLGGDVYSSQSSSSITTALSSYSSSSVAESFSVQMDTDQIPCLRHWRPSVTRRTLVLVTSCMTVALTALTLLSVVLS